MWTCRPRLEGRIEVEFEALVLREGIVRHFKHVDLVIAFKVNDPCSVFVEEVVRHYEAIVIAAQHQVVRSCVCTKAHHQHLLQFRAVCCVQHHDLPCHESTNDQPVTAPRSRHDLAHTAGYRSIYVRLHGRQIKRGGTRSPYRIDQVDMAVEHALSLIHI